MTKKIVLITDKPPSLIYKKGDIILIEEPETRWWKILIYALLKKKLSVRMCKYVIVGFKNYQVTLEKRRWWAPMRAFNPSLRGSIPRSPSSVINEEVEV